MFLLQAWRKMPRIRGECQIKYRIADITTTATFTVILVLGFLLSQINYVEGQAVPFIRTCQDPLVQNHINKFTHTYCFHACGYLSDPSMDFSSCTATGECICNYPCDTPAPATMFASDVCPPFASDPADTDATALPRCQSQCASRCPGGQGMVCGEVEALGPAMNMYAKICTCYCPPQPCTPPTTQISIIKKPKPLLKLVKLKLIVWKAVLKKMFKLCLLIFKLCFLYLLKLALILLYYLLFYEYINWELDLILRQTRWIFGPLFDNFNFGFFDT